MRFMGENVEHSPALPGGDIIRPGRRWTIEFRLEETCR
jgi:hypothetical protein